MNDPVAVEIIKFTYSEYIIGTHYKKENSNDQTTNQRTSSTTNS